jgi:hypothetical protein
MEHMVVVFLTCFCGAFLEAYLDPVPDLAVDWLAVPYKAFARRYA